MPCVGASLRMEGLISLPVSTNTVVDEVNTDDYGCVVWSVLATRYTGSGQSDRVLYKIFATHDGSPVADATEAGSEFNVTIEAMAGNKQSYKDISLTVELSGTGVTQVMRLIANPSTSDWSITRTRGLIQGIAP